MKTIILMFERIDTCNIFRLQIDKIVLSVAWYRRLNKRHYLQRFIFQSNGTYSSNLLLPFIYLFLPPSLPPFHVNFLQLIRIIFFIDS